MPERAVPLFRFFTHQEDYRMTPDQEKGQHGQCETMKVKMLADGSDAVINAHDFDADKHEKVDAKAKKSEGKK